MLRITSLESTEGTATLKLEGRVAGPWVAELKRTADALLQRRPIGLDLSDVTYVDAQGAALLRDLQARQASVYGCSSFVAELLRPKEGR